jgi:hypothetical protein
LRIRQKRGREEGIGEDEMKVMKKVDEKAKEKFRKRQLKRMRRRQWRG